MKIRPRLTPAEYEVILAYRDGKIQFTPSSSPEENGAKILLYDIETSPIMGFFWGLWQQNINIDFIKSDWYMLSWAAKWLNEDTIFSDVISPEEVKEEDDKRITFSLWELIDQADIVVGHNAKKFDVRKMNTRFFYHGLPKPSSYKVVDTLSVMRKNLACSSNKLDYFNKWMGLGGKIKVDASLWTGCINGDYDALKRMVEYNENDVILLEKDYLKLRGWIDDHPNLNVYNNIEIPQCSACGSTSITWGGYEYTKVGKYKAYRCNDCQYSGRSRYNVLTAEKRKTILR